MVSERYRWMFPILAVFIPPLLALALFALAIGMALIPASRDALLERKRETLRAIVSAAVSQLDGLPSRDAAARESALQTLRSLRYGPDHKDYLWILDRDLRMVMHPYRPDLEGQSMADFRDTAGKRVFVESLAIIDRHGEGYVDYFWQWQDDPHRIKPKLSFIREFKPWGWIIGTGIYVDDVQAEVRRVTGRLYGIAALAGIGMLLLLAIGIRQGWRSERLRRIAERQLEESRERYRALAHASADLALLFIRGRIAGANRTACELLHTDEHALIGQPADTLLPEPGNPLLAAIHEGRATPECETFLRGSDQSIPALLTCSVIDVHGESAVMLSGRDLRPALQAANAPGNPMEALPLQALGLGRMRVANDGALTLRLADPLATRIWTGTDTADLTGQTLAGLLPPAEFALVVHELKSRGALQGIRLNPLSSRSLRLWMAGAEALVGPAAPPDSVDPRHAESAADAPRSAPLHRIRQDSIAKLRAAVRSGCHAARLTETAAQAVDEIFQKAGALALQELGPAPAPFTLLAVGSIGRREPSLVSDQDTCLLYDDSAGNRSWFESFGAAVTALCHQAGLPPCPKNHTAANPAWILSFSEWKGRFESWIRQAEPEALLEVNIYFDFRPVFGDAGWDIRLRRHIFDLVQNRPVFLHLLAGDTLQFKAPVDLLGRIRPDHRGDESLNLKAAMLHIVNFARIYALRHRIFETGTALRLQALGQAGLLPSDLVRDTLDAWDYLMEFRFRVQAARLDHDLAPDNIVLLSALSTWDRQTLKMALGQVAHLQHRLSTDLPTPA